MKLTKNFNNLPSVQNSNNVQNVIIGLKEVQDVTQWHVVVECRFVMIVEELAVGMARVIIRARDDLVLVLLYEINGFLFFWVLVF